MAIAGASVIAINPVAPTLPVVQERAVELSGWIDPIGVVGDTITTTVRNLGTQGAGILTEGLPAAWEIITASSLYSEIATAVFNPFPGFEQFFGNLSTYATTIGTGLKESAAGSAEHYGKLPEALQTAWDFVLQGQFTKAFATITSWNIFGLGELGWPLEPIFKIPGEIARDFGLKSVAAVLDVLLVADNATTGYAYSLLSPPITAVYQLTDILNVVSASIYDGDWVTAISEVINAPAKVLNAFLNGYQPSVAAEWEFFPGVFSKDGPIDAFFVQLPKAIAAALAGVAAGDEDTETGTAADELSLVSSPALAGGDSLVTLPVSTGTEEDAATAVPDEDAGTTAPAEPTPTDTTTPVDDEDAAEDETVADPAEDATEEESDDVTEDDVTEDDVTDEDTTDSADDSADESDDAASDTDAGGESPDTGSGSAGDSSDAGDSGKSDSKSDSGKSDSGE
ncbi:hypothetical protein C6A87_009085 [Mycobacterium sp. ITM-2016-00317]|uniref:hypothetical protein n=1 Tax=Mycobacterium sp. ITM-2016-00317 TaxID=2099694 RepID=UPI00287FB310|nr:hypothetical protein [Mycobacterium sp. ITM-2016-00317]WNG89302.1 hypothetical protein C6A87_009085 [Mycobacterium sp. ITM-2016-00317]